MKRVIFHYLGSSYARHIHNYLTKTLTQYQWQTVEFGQEIPISGTLLLSPTPNDDALNLVRALPKEVKVVLLLDLNHQFFEDATSLLSCKKISIVFAPFKLANFRSRYIPALSVEMARMHIEGPASNSEDYFYVSQPLREDDRPGPDQFQLLGELLVLAQVNHKVVYCKRHPRETESLPPDIESHNHFRLWEGSIEEAYAEFQNWFGLNALPLLCAEALGRCTYFYKNDRWDFPGAKKSILG